MNSGKLQCTIYFFFNNITFIKYDFYSPPLHKFLLYTQFKVQNIGQKSVNF
jgi:hypothetical protein